MARRIIHISFFLSETISFLLQLIYIYFFFLLLQRKKLEAWECRWREVLYRTFVDQVDAMKQSFFSNRQDKRMSLYPYLVTLPVDDFVNIMMQVRCLLERFCVSTMQKCILLMFDVSKIILVWV